MMTTTHTRRARPLRPPIYLYVHTIISISRKKKFREILYQYNILIFHKCQFRKKNMIVKVQLFIELLNEQLLNFCICLDNKKKQC